MFILQSFLCSSSSSSRISYLSYSVYCLSFVVLLFFTHTILFCELVFHRFFLSASQVSTVPQQVVLQWPHPWPHFKDNPEKAETRYTKDCIISRFCSHMTEELQDYAGAGGPSQPPAAHGQMGQCRPCFWTLVGSGPTIAVPWKLNALGPSTTVHLCLLPLPSFLGKILGFWFMKISLYFLF